MERKNTGFVITIIILVIALLATSGFIVYDKVLNKDSKVETKIEDNSEDNNDITDNNLNEEKVEVIDAVSYTDSYYHMFKVTLPQITSQNPSAQKLNRQMLEEVLTHTYSGPVMHAETYEDYYKGITTSSSSFDKGMITDYEYLIKNNVIAIYIKDSIPEGGTAAPASGNGLSKYNYFYDIENDKILKFSEAIQLMEITDIGGAPNYDSLDSVCTYMNIEDSVATIFYSEGGC